LKVNKLPLPEFVSRRTSTIAERGARPWNQTCRIADRAITSGCPLDVVDIEFAEQGMRKAMALPSLAANAKQHEMRD